MGSHARVAALYIASAGILSTAQIEANPTDYVLRRDDGSSIYWTIDRQDDGAKQGVLLVAQGSGCLAATENPNIAKARRLLPDFAVVTVEKYGVEPHAKPKDPFEGCSAAFYAHHTVSQRVIDYQRVLDHLVMFGGAKGGAAVAILAPRVNATAAVIFSSAPGHSFAQLFKMTVPPEVARNADEEFKKIKAAPTSTNVWGGNSYRWWTDILNQDMTAELLRTTSSVLLVQGDRDSHAPVAIAREIRDEFQRAGRSNLTYWEFPGYDHAMQDEHGTSHLDEVMARISKWLTEQLVSR
jgi:pimeloyl-ACP methyl ester carboxylesterase